MSDTMKSETFSDYISLERQGRMVIVTYDRGDGLNTLSVKGMTELKQAALMLAEDTKSSAVILKGGKAFSAGADLKDPARVERDAMPLLEQRAALKLGPDMCQAWAGLEQMTIAAIEGFCIGGGLALAASCDHRVSADTAHFRLPEIPLGMNMSWQAVPRLVALVGPSKAKELIVLGKRVEAETALDWGLVDRLAPEGEVYKTATLWAEAYAALPPLALRMTKQAIDACATPLGQTASFMDRDQFLLTTQSKDQTEAIAAFLQKRPAEFSGD